MAASPENKAKSAEDADLQIPIQKTNPLVYVGVVVGVLIIGGVVGFTVFSGDEEKEPDENLAASVHSARAAAAAAKAKEKERERHLELAAKAFAAASEKERAAAAASAAAAAEAEEEEAATKSGGGKPSGPAKPAGPNKSDLDQLDELGSEVNSELGGP